MAEKKTIELDIQSNLGSLRSQLKQAQADVAEMADKFGATSKQAQDAAKKAAKLKDAIGDAKDLTDAFNPDAKMGAFTKSLGGVLDGLQGVQGAMGMFGVETEGVEKAMLKVQSAMALSQGYKGVMESIDSFKTLITQVKSFTVIQKISTALQWLWNTAMEANPIMAIATAIIAVLAVGYKLISWLMESSEANETAMDSVNKHSAAIDKQNRQLEQSQTALSGANKFQYEYARASGASAEQLRKLALKHAQEELALAKKNKELSRATYLREADILAMYRAQELSEDVINKQLEVVKKAKENATKFNEIFVKENAELLDLKRQQIVEIKQEDEAEKKRRAQDEADRLKEQKDNSTKFYENKKDAIEDLKSLDEEYRVSQLSEQDQELLEVTKKYEKAYEEAKKFKLDVTKLKENEAAEKAAIEKKYRDLEIKEMNNMRLVILDDAKESLKATLDQKKKEGEAFIEASIAKRKLAEEDLKKQKETEEKKKQLQFDAAKDTLSMLSDLTTLFAGKSKKEQEKAFKIQKAINIANAVVDTYMAANKALASAPPPYSFIAMGAAITAGLVNVKKISATKFDSGTAPSAGGGGTSGAGGGASVMSPSFNVVGNSGINQLAQLQQQPMKAYVVSSDVTSAQSLDRNRIENATLVQ